jgi:4-hydroxy-tetrahydrodipicolinate synthase
MARFGRVLTAMVTPFDDDGALDLDVARQLARHLQDNGNDGLVIAGTTGESPVLTDDERLSLFAAVIEAVTIPVIAGTGTNDTAHSVHMTREATALGAAGILAVCPYYNRPSQAGIEGHVRAMAAASELPVMVYDIPVRTGRKITTATLLRLAREVPNVLALKDAAGNPGETAGLISSAPDGFEVYSGDDVFTLPLLAAGIVGSVGVATHWTGLDHQEMFDLWEKGDTFGARLVNSRMLESFAFETGDDAPNPIPTKAILRHQGIRVGQARLPMGDAPEFVEQRVPQVLADLQTWRDAFPERPDR